MTEQYYQYKASLKLLGFCLHNKYFSFQNKFYEQVEGAANGITSKPNSCQSVHGTFWEKSPKVYLQPPQVCFRFLDDTWVIQQQAYQQAFLDHINSIDPAIKFTVEGTQGNGAIPFLDTLITPQADNSLSITVYCKPTILTSTCSGTAIIVYLPSTVSLVDLPTGLKQFVLDQSFSRGNYNTLGRLWLSANTPTGPSMGYKVSFFKQQLGGF